MAPGEWKCPEKVLLRDEGEESERLRQGLRGLVGKGMMELIKVEWGQGADVVVAYCAALECWLISDNENIFVAP